MNTLHATQAAFRSAILSETLPGGLFTEGVSAIDTRFGLYAYAYRARLVAALRENYPVLHRALGDDAFEDLARAYLAAHPSNHPSIRWFGGTLAAFVAAEPERLPHPALHDLIRMEWALRTAFDAPDAAALTADALAALPPEAWPDAHFALVPAAEWLALDWAIEPVWHTLNDDPDAETPAPDRLPHTLLVWRVGLNTRWRSLDPIEQALLPALAEGKTIAQLCETALDHCDADHAATVVVQCLRRWLDEGLIGTLLTV